MPNEAHEPSLTRSHDVMGSPLYMSPEQLRGVRDADVRSDIWALGAILYRLVAGQTPFDGETMAQLCSRVLMDEPPSLRALCPELPEGLAAVIERCLRKDPAERFEDVAALAGALDPFASHRSVRAAQRVVVASNRPPPLVPAPPPAAAEPPAKAKGATTNAALAQTGGGKGKSSTSLFLVVGVLAFVVGGVSLGLWRARSARTVAAPVATSTAASASAPSVPSESIDAGVAPGTAAPAVGSAAHAPTRAPAKRAAPRKPAASTPDAPDEAPDLRK
jgi:serine/threonine-protein kinase